jgi:hypothetical protein
MVLTTVGDSVYLRCGENYPMNDTKPVSDKDEGISAFERLINDALGGL